MIHIKYTLHKILNKVLQRSNVQAFFVGAMIGLIACWLYLLAGGDTWLFVPVWAEIVFYPGFAIGWYCYEFFGENIPIALLIGSLSVGLFYGVIFVLVQSIWHLLARSGKYTIAVLSIVTVLLATAFLIYLKMIDRFAESDARFRQEFTLSITSDPSGAMVYPLDDRGQPDPIGTTPFELKGSYSIDRDGSGWGVSGRGITLKSTEEGFSILLDCVVVKDGYICREIAPVLAKIPKKNTRPDLIPSKLSYRAKLLPSESSNTKKVGTAIIANGSFLAVNPSALKLAEGVYIIDIKSVE